MADFPYFRDNLTDFPSIRGLDGSSYENTFDYSAYTGKTSVLLCRVPWKSNYDDVVMFENNAARDSWFSNRAGKSLTWSTPWRRVPSQDVNVSLSYDVAMNYDYLVVTLPGSIKLFYFIDNVAYATPDVTTLSITLDVWQTYGPSLTLDVIDLERGHAPMRRSSVDAFLSDPVNNCEYLLAPDVNYGEAEVTRVAKHYPLGAGAKWLIVALPVAPAYISQAGAGTASGYSAPTYYNTGARNGYQLGVNGYVWSNANGYSYQGVELPAHSGASSDGRTLDGCYLYGIAYPTAQNALVALAAFAPHLLASARFVAIIPEAFVSPVGSASYTMAGYRWAHLNATPTVNVEPFALTREAFGLPEYAADIAKMYTAPYTKLEVSDDIGNTFEVNVCDIAGNELVLGCAVSLAADTLTCFVNAYNVGSGARLVVDWQTLTGSARTSLFGSQISDFAIKWDIPTYTVQVSAENLDSARKWYDLMVERERALLNYRQAVRSANTGRENTYSDMATATANTARANQASLTNTDRDNTGRTRLKTYNNTATTNRGRAAKSLTSYRATRSNQLTDRMNHISSMMIDVLGMYDANHQTAVARLQGLSGAAAGIMNTIGSLATGNVSGAIQSSYSSAVNYIANEALANSVVNWMNEKKHQNMYYLYDGIAGDTTITQNYAQQSFRTDIALAENDYTDANTTIDTVLADYVVEEQINNATDNANTSANASNASARASQNTTDSNANYAANDAITAAKENLEYAQLAAGARLRSEGLTLTPCGGASGDATLDAFNRRAFKVRAVTQSDYAMRAASSYFKRYGYAYGAPLEPDGWLENSNYCHWKGSRAILIGEAPNDAKALIYAMLERGVTVWADPERIGDYEND